MDPPHNSVKFNMSIYNLWIHLIIQSNLTCQFGKFINKTSDDRILEFRETYCKNVQKKKEYFL